MDGDWEISWSAPSWWRGTRSAKRKARSARKNFPVCPLPALPVTSTAWAAQSRTAVCCSLTSRHNLDSLRTICWFIYNNIYIYIYIYMAAPFFELLSSSIRRAVATIPATHIFFWLSFFYWERYFTQRYFAQRSCTCSWERYFTHAFSSWTHTQLHFATKIATATKNWFCNQVSKW